MSYASDGFVVLRNTVSQDALDNLDRNVVALLREWTGQDVGTTRSVEFAELLLADRALERRLYDSVRTFDWLPSFSSDELLIRSESVV